MLDNDETTTCTGSSSSPPPPASNPSASSSSTPSVKSENQYLHMYSAKEDMCCYARVVSDTVKHACVPKESVPSQWFDTVHKQNLKIPKVGGCPELEDFRNTFRQPLDQDKRHVNKEFYEALDSEMGKSATVCSGSLMLSNLYYPHLTCSSPPFWYYYASQAVTYDPPVGMQDPKMIGSIHCFPSSDGYDGSSDPSYNLAPNGQYCKFPIMTTDSKVVSVVGETDSSEKDIIQGELEDQPSPGSNLKSGAKTQDN